jgi:hypothetical protein
VKSDNAGIHTSTFFCRGNAQCVRRVTRVASGQKQGMLPESGASRLARLAMGRAINTQHETQTLNTLMFVVGSRQSSSRRARWLSMRRNSQCC